MKGRMSIGNLFFVFTSMDILSSNINGLINSLAELRKNFKYISLFNEFMKLPEIQKNHQITDSFKSLEFKDLSYKYPSNNLALKKINVKINKSDKLLIMGKNGSGDSDIMMTDTINPLKSKFKGFHKTFKQDDLGLSLSSFLLN